MKGKIWGIVLLVIGIAAALGSVANGTIAGFADGIGITEITTVTIILGCIVAGIILIIKNNETK